MFHTSVIRLVFDPAGTPLVLCDWGALVEFEGLPWKQAVQEDAFIGALGQKPIARGNVKRTWSFSIRQGFSTVHALAAALLAADAAVPANKTAPLHARVIRLPDPGGSEASRTQAHYVASDACPADVTFKPDFQRMTLVTRYTFSISQFVLQP